MTHGLIVTPHSHDTTAWQHQVQVHCKVCTQPDSKDCEDHHSLRVPSSHRHPCKPASADETNSHCHPARHYTTTATFCQGLHAYQTAPQQPAPLKDKPCREHHTHTPLQTACEGQTTQTDQQGERKQARPLACQGKSGSLTDSRPHCTSTKQNTHHPDPQTAAPASTKGTPCLVPVRPCWQHSGCCVMRLIHTQQSTHTIRSCTGQQIMLYTSCASALCRLMHARKMMHAKTT